MNKVLFGLILSLCVLYAAAESNEDVKKLRISTISKPDDCKKVAKNGDKLTMHYRGTLLDGTVFDESYKRGEPFSFVLGSGMVIRGWEEGIPGMCVGELRRLMIPASMGYGSRAVGPIPANSALIFEIELLDAEPGEPAEHHRPPRHPRHPDHPEHRRPERPDHRRPDHHGHDDPLERLERDRRERRERRERERRERRERHERHEQEEL